MPMDCCRGRSSDTCHRKMTSIFLVSQDTFPPFLEKWKYQMFLLSQPIPTFSIQRKHQTILVSQRTFQSFLYIPFHSTLSWCEKASPTVSSLQWGLILWTWKNIFFLYVSIRHPSYMWGSLAVFIYFSLYQVCFSLYLLIYTKLAFPLLWG